MNEATGALHARAETAEHYRQASHPAYDYTKRMLLPPHPARGCAVSMMEIAPGASNYPYHYHLEVEECFYIVRGEGMLRTAQGVKAVHPGDFFYFPPGEEGAHKLTNTSDLEPLVYIDFDTAVAVNTCIYPDSGKVGIYSAQFSHIGLLDHAADYYDGE